LGDNGIWVPAENVDALADKLGYVVNNYSSLQLLEEQNRRRVEQNFTWDIVARRYVEYISAL
jgi:glycosyltransferase involved in cell wall biosynthesis